LAGANADIAVVLRVPPESVPRMVAGIRGGDVDLVRIPAGQEPT
jgi:hypothetical protein